MIVIRFIEVSFFIILHVSENRLQTEENCFKGLEIDFVFAYLNMQSHKFYSLYVTRRKKQ